MPRRLGPGLLLAMALESVAFAQIASAQGTSGFDGQYAGRIRLEMQEMMKGQWHWAGAYPKPMRGSPIMPKAGYCATFAEAAKAVEDYWDSMKARAAGSVDPPAT